MLQTSFDRLRELVAIPRKFNIGDKVEADTDDESIVGLIIGCVQQLDHEGNQQWAYALGFFDDDGHLDYFWPDECQLQLIEPAAVPTVFPELKGSIEISQSMAEFNRRLDEVQVDMRRVCVEAYLKFLVCRQDLNSLLKALGSESVTEVSNG